MGTLYRRADRGGKAGKWYAAYLDHNGNRRIRCTDCDSRTDALKILAKWESDAVLRREGVIDPRVEQLAEHQRRPILNHADEFRASLESAGRSQKHVDDTYDNLLAIINFAGWRQLSDINATKLELYARELRKIKRSARTIQKHLAGAKQFSRWLLATSRVGYDALAIVRPPSPTKDRRLERRALSLDEWKRLKKATKSGPIRYKMPPESRVLLWELAIITGLRHNEVRELTISKLFLNESPPFVLLPGAGTKNAKPARQYITDPIVRALRSWTAGRTGPVFALCREEHLARVVRSDLAAARKQWIAEAKTEAEKKERGKSDFLKAINADGERIDFHSLRHTCGTWLAMAGVNPKTIQTIMRHSTIRLTLDTYGHLFPADESRAIEKLGQILD